MGKALGARAELDGSSRGVGHGGRKFGLRDLAVVLLAEGLGRPQCTVGGVSRGHRRSDLDCHPGASSSRVRWSADHRRSPQSRSRRPASQRTSPGSEPSVVEICRLITGRDRAACVHRTQSDPGSPRPLTSCLYFSWHAARRCYPRRPCRPFVALARRSGVTSMILARDLAALRRTLIEWPMIRVASAEAGRQPFPPPRAHDDAVRSTRRALPEEAAAIAKRRVRTPKASPGLQRDRLEMSGSFWLGPRSNAPMSPRRDGCSR